MTEPERRATLKTGEKRRSAPLVLAEALILLAILALAGVLLRQGYRRYIETVYPLKYAAFVNRAAEEYDFEPSLLFAMIYTESGFDPEAVSVADAKGLMQLTDDTFAWAQQRAGIESPLPPDRLFDPETNIHYGAFVLYLLDQQFGDRDTALAAYNAGQGRVKGWLADSRYSDDGVTLREIPFPETAAYGRKIQQAQEMYQELYQIP